ncbi:MAG: M24 family metallopeptidase [Spirochaetaceae bacterium]|nr:MAG: M24 family metallopeptidase [Spirochaetaceae bacterium]
MITRKDEIAAKEKRLRSLLVELDLDGIVLKSQANFSWFTAGGLNVVTIADTLGVSSILVTRDARLLISDNIEHTRMHDDEALGELDFEFKSFPWYEPGGERAVLSSVVRPERVGCDLPGCGYADVGAEIARLRYRLLEPEVERYRWLGVRASLALESTLTRVERGMSEAQVTGMLSEALWKDRIDSVCFQAAADERAYRYRHPIPTEKRVKEYLVVNCNARKWGLITTITRSVYLGTVPDSLREQYRVNTEIECEMIAMTTPGTTTAEIFENTKQLYADRGYPDEWKMHHQGGAQGYRNRDYVILPGSDERVLENQCFCWNPSIAGTKSEDAFIATAEGPVEITRPVLFPQLELSVGARTFRRPAILELP